MYDSHCHLLNNKHCCICIVSKGVVDLHKGKLSVSSPGEGQGSTFTLEIPLTQGSIKPVLSKFGSRLGAQLEKVYPEAKNKFLVDSENVKSYRAAANIMRTRRSSSKPYVSESDEDKRSAFDVDTDPDPVNDHKNMSSFTVNKAEEKIYADTPKMYANDNDSDNNTSDSDDEEINNNIHIKKSYSRDEIVIGVMRSCSMIIRNPVEDFSPAGIGAWRPRVLIVDDSAPNRKMLLRLMTRRSEYCEAACDGVDALNVVTKYISEGFDINYFHVCLMDQNMPNMDGKKHNTFVIYSNYIYEVANIYTPA